MSAGQPARRPGRPSSGARERILEAGLETLLADGYAGLTTTKVAVRAGENKALISYHYGSKDGLVAAAAAELGDRITREALAGLGGARTARGIATRLLRAVWEMLERDERVGRLYFDLNAVSVVEDEVRDALRAVKDRWRGVLTGLLADAGVPARRVGPATVLIIAGVEGLVLERLERGDNPELTAGCRLFAEAVGSVAGAEPRAARRAEALP